MKIISSQKYLNDDVVSEKISILSESKPEYIDIPIIDCNLQDDNGVDLYLLPDRHHTIAAARYLSIKTRYVIVAHSEGLTGVGLLDNCYIDSAYYDINTGKDIDFK